MRDDENYGMCVSVCVKIIKVQFCYIVVWTRTHMPSLGARRIEVKEKKSEANVTSCQRVVKRDGFQRASEGIVCTSGETRG